MCWTTSDCNAVPLDGSAFSHINIHFCSQSITVQSVKCQSCLIFVKHAVVELGSAKHSEHKIISIFHYFVHTL